MNDSKALVGAITGSVVLFFIGLFLFAKFGPSIPFTISQVTTTKTDFFTVDGEGKVLAVPDIAQVNLGFTANGASVTTVQSQANGTIKNITDAVKNLGIDPKDIQTTNYNLSPNYDYTIPGSQKIKGYAIDVNILVKVRDFNKINNVIDAATTNGANQVGGLNFILDDSTQTKLQSEARKQAIYNAKQKAAEIAAETGINLGRIINVNESQNNPGPRPLMMAAKSADAGTAPSVPTQVEPGSSEITIDVTLSYETR